MTSGKCDRALELLFRGLRGEDLSVKDLAAEYNTSTKSISRSINDVKAFLADHRELVGNTELEYSYSRKSYRLCVDGFLTNKELFLLTEILIASRALPEKELLKLIQKMRHFTTTGDRQKLDRLIRNELNNYSEVGRDCASIVDTLWQLVDCIDRKCEITIEYYRSDRSCRDHRLQPESVMFSEFYFYLIAFDIEGDPDKPKYYRVDRIKSIAEHKNGQMTTRTEFDEGLLRRRSLFMWPGKLRTIRFEYTGPSVQAVLDKLPTARIVECHDKVVTFEAEVYGDGIRMWLLSQGDYVKVLSPEEFVSEMKATLKKMLGKYVE